MRIEIDDKLLEALDSIKLDQPTIAGRGHTETVRFLVNYYKTHKSLQKLFDEFGQLIRELPDVLIETLQGSLDQVILKGLGRVFQRLIVMADEKRTVEDSRGLNQAQGERR